MPRRAYQFRLKGTSTTAKTQKTNAKPKAKPEVAVDTKTRSSSALQRIKDAFGFGTESVGATQSSRQVHQSSSDPCTTTTGSGGSIDSNTDIFLRWSFAGGSQRPSRTGSPLNSSSDHREPSNVNNHAAQSEHQEHSAPGQANDSSSPSESPFMQFTEADIDRIDPSGRSNCPYDNVFHRHDDPRPTQAHPTLHAIVRAKLQQQPTTSPSSNTSRSEPPKDTEICKCHRSSHGFDIIRKTLTHGEGRLYPPISSPICMLCSIPIGFLEKTMTHAEIRPQDFTCACTPCTRYTQLLPSTTAPALSAANPGTPTQRVKPLKVFCGQTYHLRCALAYIERESWAVDVVCPGCKTLWPVQHGVIRKMGRWFGSWI